MPIEASADGHSQKSRAIFFDRDGVVNTRIVGGYVRNPQELEVSPLVAEVLKEVKQRGYLAIVITNQRGVGLGLMTLEELAIVHRELQNRLDQTIGVTFDDIFFATGIDKSDLRRKPSPVMLQEAAEKWNIDLAESWMIGDSKSDIEAGQRAGTKTAYLVTVNTEEIPEATRVLHSLDEILKYI